MAGQETRLKERMIHSTDHLFSYFTPQPEIFSFTLPRLAFFFIWHSCFPFFSCLCPIVPIVFYCFYCPTVVEDCQIPAIKLLVDRAVVTPLHTHNTLFAILIHWELYLRRNSFISDTFFHKRTEFAIK